MKLWLSIFSLLIITSAQASVGQISLKGGSWSFTTENVTNSTESSSGFGAYSVEMSYGLTPKLQGVFGVNILMSEIYTGSSGYGFDLGAKYFPFTDSGSINLESDDSTIFIQEKFRPYVGLFLRQRIFSLAQSASYVGPGLSIGLDYAWSRKWFLNSELRYDNLYGSGDAIATQINILVGFGREF
ncbi:MAG: hypothetical protein MJK18_11955 [Bdellovibrionales bacterium]|nr:hypothetical protein [Bdellovibrionales bacterium]